MEGFYIYLTAALGAWNLPLGASAQGQECETTDTPDLETGDKILRVTSPNQLDVFDDCTTITGHIVIDYDYDGDFILNGITDFAGNISTDAESGCLSPSLGLVEMLDLVDLGNIALYGLMGDVHLPKLERAGDVVLGQASSSAEVNVGSLVEAENVKIMGSWTGINVESLETVNHEIQFCGAQECQIFPDEDFPYLEIDLPSLKTIDYLEFIGTVKSISVPNLEVVGFREYVSLIHYQGLTINIQEGKFNLDFDAPKLHTLNGTLNVYGGITSLTLGALEKGNVDITLIPRAPLDMYSTVRNVGTFNLWGTLHSIDLRNFVSSDMVRMAYEPKLPCNETLYRLWDLTPKIRESEDSNRCTRPDVTDDDDTSDTNQSTDSDHDDTTDDENTSSTNASTSTSTTGSKNPTSTETSSDRKATGTSDNSTTADSNDTENGASQPPPLPFTRAIAVMVIVAISGFVY
ncbi:hypothetical protein BJX76DRAFT_355577 [Aspergillus varians]